MITFRIKGIVKEKETGHPLPGFFIKSYDKDLLFDDLLGSSFSDQNGKFDIICELSDFKDFFEKKPDIFFKVFNKDRTSLIHTTKDAIRWNVGKLSDHEILISYEEIESHTKPEVVLIGNEGKQKEEFSAGESLTIMAKGLRPRQTCNFKVSVDGKHLFTSTLLTNSHGEIQSQVLWPQIGLDDPNSESRFTPEEAEKKWVGKNILINITQNKKNIADARLKITGTSQTPIVICSDKNGRLLNGFEVNTQSLYLTIYNLPFAGDARIFLVQRQYDWNLGDRFQIASFRDGSATKAEVSVKQGRIQQTIEFAGGQQLLPGAYDFILRPLRYGYEEDEVYAILASDIIGSRNVTGVVIREGFWTAKPVLGGCVNKIPVSGASVIGTPYFRYRDTFTLGEDVWAGLDPGIVDPGNISKMCSMYVIQSKDDIAWANNSLNHILGNANTTKHKLQAGCMNANKVLVWPAVNQAGQFDIIADFGNNTSDAAMFVQDDQYNTPLDIIDGYFVAGFRVVPDPGTMTESSISNYGNWNYIEADFPMFGVNGTVAVQDETAAYHSSTPPTIVTRNVRMKAHVFFPADMMGVTDPAQISAAKSNYPLIVVIHGNGQDYFAYDFLLQHFAMNGFIAASIDVRYFNGTTEAHGMAGQGRAEMLFHHLKVLQGKFGGKVQNNIGIMGHSRGGEAVVKAVRINQQQGYTHNINAVISLAPTDRYGAEILGGTWSKPYFALYGSRDGDVKGGPPTTANYTVAQCGFSLYDRANGNFKSMCFLLKATHNGFITSNVDAPWDGDNIMDMEPVATQQTYVKAYMNAFFRWHLLNESQWDGMFKGEWKPASVSSTGAKSHMQYRDTTLKTVDDFEGPINWQQSSIGGTVTHNMTLPVNPSENKMSAAVVAGLDPKSPHDTQGLKIKWNNAGDRLEFSIPAIHKDVKAYSVLSFRVTQTIDSLENMANQSQNFRVALKDGANNERAIRVSPFYDIPFPDFRPNHANSKSAMNTVRIPLKSFTIVCAGQVQVNLQDVTTLSFLFSETGTGEIEVDEVEFSN